MSQFDYLVLNFNSNNLNIQKASIEAAKVYCEVLRKTDLHVYIQDILRQISEWEIRIKISKIENLSDVKEDDQIIFKSSQTDKDGGVKEACITFVPMSTDRIPQTFQRGGKKEPVSRQSSQRSLCALLPHISSVYFVIFVLPISNLRGVDFKGGETHSVVAISSDQVLCETFCIQNFAHHGVNTKAGYNHKYRHIIINIKHHQTEMFRTDGRTKKKKLLSCT